MQCTLLKDLQKIYSTFFCCLFVTSIVCEIMGDNLIKDSVKALKDWSFLFLNKSFWYKCSLNLKHQEAM